jgi:aldehyde:ferredoxin oxidoreductase
LKAARTKHLGQLNSRAGKFKQFGTVAGMAHAVQTGDTPVKNWSGTALDFPNAAAISDNSVINMQERKYACWHCPIACGGLMKAGSGEYSYQPGAHKPEYETLAAFGSMCLNDHLESIIKLNDICNRSGLDTISAGAIVAFAIECYENGIINNRDTDGIELRWGNHKSIVEITEKLVKREGLGNVLADGVMRAAKQIGSEAEKIAIHIHGQEVPMHDPKRYLSYATAYLDTTPARHTQGSCGSMPASGLECPPYDKGSFSGRGEANKMGSDLMHIVNCSGVCLFGFQFMDASAIPEFINSTTGWTYSINDLLKIGERIASLRQAFNIREGVSISAFTIPGRVRGNPPLPIGPTAGKSVDMETLRNDYLIARDWDIKTGKPSKKKLLDLGLSDVAKVLWGGEK